MDFIYQIIILALGTALSFILYDRFSEKTGVISIRKGEVVAAFHKKDSESDGNDNKWVKITKGEEIRSREFYNLGIKNTTDTDVINIKINVLKREMLRNDDFIVFFSKSAKENGVIFEPPFTIEHLGPRESMKISLVEVSMVRIGSGKILVTSDTHKFRKTIGTKTKNFLGFFD